MSSSKNKPISKSRSLNKPVRLDRGEDVGGFSPVIPQSTEKSRSKSPSQIGDRKSTSASKSLEKQASQSVASGSAEKPRSKSPSVTPRPRVASPPPAPPSDLMQSSGTTPRARSNSIARGKNISKMRNSMFNESAPSPATRSLLDQSQPSTGVKKGTSTRNLKGASGGQSRSASPGVAVPSSSLAHAGDDDEDNAEDSSGADRSWWRFCCCKTDPIMRLVKVLSAFPFIIIVASLDLSTSYSILRSPLVVRAMNLMIYVLPGMVVYLVLAKTDDASIQRIAMFFYISLYLLPVGMNVMYKLKVSSSSSKIEEGTFCFKPARSVRMSTTANIFAMSSIVMEWMQHCLYVLPLGIVSSRTEPATLSSFPPYLPFLVYYWGSVISVFICALIVILNAVLKGKAHYRLQRSDITWYFLFNFAGSLYVTVVTILFMGFWCARDGGDGDYVLVQDPRIVCWETDHLRMAVCGLVALAIYLVQNTLLPAGTFKETMRDNDLEIMFVPVYLQAHFFLKAIFCGIYVSFYFDDWARITTLTVVNLLLLGLSNAMKPCSVEWVNLLRDTFFMHASLSGLQALNYLLWPISDATTGLLTTTLASNILFVCIVVYIYYINTARSIEYEIAKAFLDLEWQVSRGGFVHPRVLEPLICLTLSTDETDWEVAKKYIGQMVWLISYPNMRVQFQSAWGIANLALCDNDSRIKIHESGGTKALFEWYLDMEFVVQLEALAALTNLTLSEEVCDVMVSTYGCIPFFLGLAASSKLKHSQFATIAVGNIAKVEKYREAIRKAGGVQILVGCIMSHDYSKRRYGCLALANLALSNVADIAQVFESPGLIDRIIKMALRKEIETQKEVTALVRNLTCHIRLRPLLLERGVMQAVQASKTSVYAEVREWCDEITYLLQSEVTTGGAASSLITSLNRRPESTRRGLLRKEGATTNIDLNAKFEGLSQNELLAKMTPLTAAVTWDTWGSKLENIFASVFSQLPTLQGISITTSMNDSVEVPLATGVATSFLDGWRDNMSYTVINRPVHGTLSEYAGINQDQIVYTPAERYHGSDFFTYFLTLGGMKSPPATVAITVQRYKADGGVGKQPSVSKHPSMHTGSTEDRVRVSKRREKEKSSHLGVDESNNDDLDVEMADTAPVTQKRISKQKIKSNS